MKAAAAARALDAISRVLAPPEPPAPVHEHEWLDITDEGPVLVDYIDRGPDGGVRAKALVFEEYCSSCPQLRVAVVPV